MTNYFEAEVAARYDASTGHEFEPAVIAATVDVLADLAGDGAALELGIGTGRIALPLAARGVPVHGIDLSSDMVAQLRAKAGGGEIPVAIGDFATTRVDGRFSLVYVVFNTIMNLTTQDAQVACFQNAAAHLDPGGAFVVEVGRSERSRARGLRPERHDTWVSTSTSRPHNGSSPTTSHSSTIGGSDSRCPSVRIRRASST